jgi:hypothetical protein
MFTQLRSNKREETTMEKCGRIRPGRTGHNQMNTRCLSAEFSELLIRVFTQNQNQHILCML